MEALHLSTPQLQIRNLELKDLTDFLVYRSKPEVTKYQGFDVMTYEQAEEFIRKQLNKKFGKAGEWVQYAIESKATGKLIGDCAIRLNEDDIRIAEIGITISHLEQQKGFAKEALLGILRFLFDEKEIHRVAETVNTENKASINLLKSTGFRYEGHFIENIFSKGKWESHYKYAMLKREWNDFNHVKKEN